MTDTKQKKKKAERAVSKKATKQSVQTASAEPTAAVVTKEAPTASKSTLGRKPKRNTYSNKPDMAKLSIRLYPDQDEAVRKLALESDRSRNAVVWVIIDWYLRGVEDGTLMSPKGDSREDTLIYKQPAFQFRANKPVIDRLWELAEKYEYARINPFIIAIVDEYLSQHGKS